MVSTAETASHHLHLSESAMEILIYDMIDFVRQIASDFMLDLHERIIKSYIDRDIDQFKDFTNLFLRMLGYLDDLLLSHPRWRVSTIALPSRKVSQHDYTRHSIQARTLITQWHPTAATS